MNMYISLLAVIATIIATCSSQETDNSSAHVFLLVVPENKVESLRRRAARQEEGVGAIGAISEAVGPAANVGQILQGVLGGDLSPIFAGSTAFIPEGDFREGVTEILQQTIAPTIQRIIMEFNRNVVRHFNMTTTTPAPAPVQQPQQQPQQQGQFNNPNGNNQFQQQQNFNNFNNPYQQQGPFQPNYNQFQQPNQQFGGGGFGGGINGGGIGGGINGGGINGGGINGGGINGGGINGGGINGGGIGGGGINGGGIGGGIGGAGVGGGAFGGGAGGNFNNQYSPNFQQNNQLYQQQNYPNYQLQNQANQFNPQNNFPPPNHNQYQQQSPINSNNANFNNQRFQGSVQNSQPPFSGQGQGIFQSNISPANQQPQHQFKPPSQSFPQPVNSNQLNNNQQFNE